MRNLRIIVTRSADSPPELADRLASLGAKVIPFPVIAFRAPLDRRPLDRALDRLALFDWLVFTSGHAVRRFFARLYARGADLRAVGHLRLAVVGPGTGEALKVMGLRPDVVPRRYVAEGLAAALKRVGVRGARILFPRARDARETLPTLLAALGAEVAVVEAYRSVPVRHGAARVRALFTPLPDALTFASAQTARNFASAVGAAWVGKLRAHAAVASIGPVTSAALRELKLPPTVEAAHATLPALVRAVVKGARNVR